jgi:hydroxymethylglutaryl-CoA lyase
VSTLGFPYSISETFLRKNQNQSPENALEELEKIQKKADDAGLSVVVYISMAFGNPYRDPWSIDEIVDAVELLEAEDFHLISLADTVGMASAKQIADVVQAVRSKYDYLEIGVHLHSRPEQATEKILAAYDAGCRRFDSAIGGLGGCPFAQDALVGNIPTETVIEGVRQRGVQLPALKSLDTLLKATGGIAARYSEFHAAD